MKRIIAGGCAALLAFCTAMVSAGSAFADPYVTRSPAVAPVLGNTIRGSTTTVFSISTGGVVTRTSGDAIRISTGSVTAPTININCGLLNLNSLCALRFMRVTITPVTGAGSATITKFRVSGMTGATYRLGVTPPEAASMTFDLNPIGLLNPVNIKLGMDVSLAPGASGVQTFDYSVSVQFVT
ncbi:MAG: hypothetical protein EON88_21720 [Brevundimonas sp.]|nr:MAG: hypothetical protein EON88_21720 [Brevundimonas sp.]